MGALSVLQNPDSYMIYQNEDLKIDYTTQIKRKDNHISQQLKDIMKKSYLATTPASNLGKYIESEGIGPSKKQMKKGGIVRTGDVVRFGRVPVRIKESNLNKLRYEEIKEKTKNDKICESPSPDYLSSINGGLNETNMRLNQSTISENYNSNEVL